MGIEALKSTGTFFLPKPFYSWRTFLFLFIVMRFSCNFQSAFYSAGSNAKLPIVGQKLLNERANIYDIKMTYTLKMI